MDDDHSKHKNEEPKIGASWLNRITQRENPLWEVYDLLIVLVQQKHPPQLKVNSA